jgi:hypothetical protein
MTITTQDLYLIALAVAKANQHGTPEQWANSVVEVGKSIAAAASSPPPPLEAAAPPPA